jgi:hypothetical protein
MPVSPSLGRSRVSIQSVWEGRECKKLKQELSKLEHTDCVSPGSYLLIWLDVGDRNNGIERCWIKITEEKNYNKNNCHTNNRLT